ncbi:NAD(P)H-binding protein [Sphingorhabdus sp. SMR4y]|uniref:NAD(P)H-binding protein n=1 Tax=Sphingorhabdus sp. SMR4y TaxID=2584094 RepID=UPI000B5C4AB3|nr:NAD(P)H-binding protein [Sphingorhabdus sp. SMR4y]ASK86893.1 NAD(P)H-binding protein [Sphingorhabdus sp. SMR4y]
MADTILILGATGLIGGLLTRKLVGQGRDKSLHLLLRRPYREDVGKARVHVQLQENWPATIAGIKPDIVISCLGSTMKKAGSKEEFAAVDRDLVGAVAAAAKAAGARQFIAISSTMADSSASSFYLKTKGEAEDLMRAEKFDRLDIIRPGLLRGERTNDNRLGESLAIAASPVMDILLHGKLRRFRSILASDVADAIIVLMADRQPGEFVHENDSIWDMV